MFVRLYQGKVLYFRKHHGSQARLARWIRPSVVEFDPAFTGWPWQSGTAAWVEPTVHAVMALRQALKHSRDARTAKAIAGRIVIGQRMLLDRRCRDGG